jgi:glycosyltransferase involved in cell wall biosynthesis
VWRGPPSPAQSRGTCTASWGHKGFTGKAPHPLFRPCIAPVYPLRVTISVVLITKDEEANLAKTLESVLPLIRDGKGEIIVLDSGSTDRTLEIAQSYGAKIFSEPWKGFAAQKNSAMEKASCDWVLQLDADESLESGLAGEIYAAIHGFIEPLHLLSSEHTDSLDAVEMIMAVDEARAKNGDPPTFSSFWIPRKNFFLGRWIKHGGYYPDPKLRLIRRGAGTFEEYGAHPTMKVNGPTGHLRHALIHNAYPTLRGYIEHMNSYSSSGAEVVIEKGHHGFSILNITVRPILTFIYNYFFRRGFVDGREGLLLHLYHSGYVSWKYAKAWELARRNSASHAPQ